jgi:hypothetical protein
MVHRRAPLGVPPTSNGRSFTGVRVPGSRRSPRRTLRLSNFPSNVMLPLENQESVGSIAQNLDLGDAAIDLGYARAQTGGGTQEVKTGCIIRHGR